MWGREGGTREGDYDISVWHRRQRGANRETQVYMNALKQTVYLASLLFAPAYVQLERSNPFECISDLHGRLTCEIL